MLLYRQTELNNYRTPKHLIKYVKNTRYVPKLLPTTKSQYSDIDGY